MHAGLLEKESGIFIKEKLNFGEMIMKVVTFYFSGTGNTEWVINQFHKILEDRGHTTKSFAIENISSEQSILELVADADFIGVANPIYGANIPRNIRAFIMNLTEVLNHASLVHSKLFFINTVGYVNGFGYFRTRGIVKKSNLQIIGYANIKLFSNVASTNTNSKITNIELNKRKSKAIARLEKLVNHLEKNKVYFNGIGPHLIIGGVIRRLIQKDMENNYLNFVVDKALCTKCMKCVNHCPTNSIEYEKVAFIFKSTCISCMRCYNLCPANAIDILKGDVSKGIGKYIGVDTITMEDSHEKHQ